MGWVPFRKNCLNLVLNLDKWTCSIFFNDVEFKSFHIGILWNLSQKIKVWPCQLIPWVVHFESTSSTYQLLIDFLLVFTYSAKSLHFYFGLLKIVQLINSVTYVTQTVIIKEQTPKGAVVQLYWIYSLFFLLHFILI